MRCGIRSKRRLLQAALAGVAWLAGIAGSLAQQWPQKPVRLLAPFPPGGAADWIGRALAESYSKKTGQQFVVDNRGGAGGTIAVEMVASAPPDGYTLLIGSTGPMTISPHLYKNLKYNSQSSFEHIVLLGQTPCLLLVGTTYPAKSITELIALSKTRPSGLSMASAGSGSINHLVGEYFRSKAGLQLVHIPYKGAALAYPDVISGNVDLIFATVQAALPLVQGGRLRALGVTSPKRSPALADVPTFEEGGIKGFHVVAWWGVHAPSKTPAAIIDMLNAEANRWLETAATVENLKRYGVDAIGGRPDALARQVSTELVRWAEVVRSANIKAD